MSIKTDVRKKLRVNTSITKVIVFVRREGKGINFAMQYRFTEVHELKQGWGAAEGSQRI